MRLTVAGEHKEYADGLTVAELIRIEKVETPEYVTISVGDTFIPSAEIETAVLHDGDTVEFLYFMGGGR